MKQFLTISITLLALTIAQESWGQKASVYHVEKIVGGTEGDR